MSIEGWIAIGVMLAVCVYAAIVGWREYSRAYLEDDE